MTQRLSLAVLLAALASTGCGPGNGDGTDMQGDLESDGTSGSESDARVSSSAGEEGGVVVLWPRIIGEGDDAAALIQQRLREIAERVLPGHPVDVRPAPERVCPQSGCRGISLGALLIATAEGCASVALVSPPGQSAAKLVPWSGFVTLQSSEVPFREPPESHVHVGDFVPCDGIEETFIVNQPEVETAVRQAAESN